MLLIVASEISVFCPSRHSYWITLLYKDGAATAEKIEMLSSKAISKDAVSESCEV